MAFRSDLTQVIAYIQKAYHSHRNADLREVFALKRISLFNNSTEHSSVPKGLNSIVFVAALWVTPILRPILRTEGQGLHSPPPWTAGWEGGFPLYRRFTLWPFPLIFFGNHDLPWSNGSCTLWRCKPAALWALSPSGCSSTLAPPLC